MQHGFVVEHDIAIPVSDGLELRANLFCPENGGTYPTIATMGPYPKDVHFSDWDSVGVYPLLEEQGEYMHWETVNPEWWVPHGYCVLRIDSRGTGASPGVPFPLGEQEMADFYDAIEWTAIQPFSDGKVAVAGISYFAMSAWRIAAERPPHLEAIIAWEGVVDLYRDRSRHGGILCNTFAEMMTQKTKPHQNTEAFDDTDLAAEAIAASRLPPELLAPDRDSQRPDLGAIEVPLFSVANWGGAGMHLRGNIEGYLGAGSQHKQLRIHVGDHVRPFYTLEGRLEQKRFLDHWLKGIDTGLPGEPPIKMAIRGHDGAFTWRDEHEWPLARTAWTSYFADAATGSISPPQPAGAASVTYDAADAANNSVSFRTEFAERTEITGPLALRVWVSATEGDADLMVVLRHLDAHGVEIEYPAAVDPWIGAGYGWLRLSHRELDSKRSAPYRPYHRHLALDPPEPDEIVMADVEILPTCLVFEPGHSLVLQIGSQDDPRMHPFTHTDPQDRKQTGLVTIHTGDTFNTRLLLPVIPSR
jgi:putative CocE/NonD family hydrolase